MVWPGPVRFRRLLDFRQYSHLRQGDPAAGAAADLRLYPLHGPVSGAAGLALGSRTPTDRSPGRRHGAVCGPVGVVGVGAGLVFDRLSLAAARLQSDRYPPGRLG